jgi:uncharacterized protein YggE
MNPFLAPNSPQWRNVNMDITRKIIQVTGEGNTSSVPNKADVVLGVVTENLNVEEAQKQNSRITNEVVNVFTRVGISKEDLQTLSYTINPEYDYKDGQSILRGYKVIHLFKLVVKDINSIGRIIDAATDVGLNRVDSINFGITNREELYNIALRNAVQNSYEKALTIAASLGVRISNVPQSVRENTTSPVSPMLYSAQAFTAKNEATPIQAGSLVISSEIVAEYLIEQ